MVKVELQTADEWIFYSLLQLGTINNKVDLQTFSAEVGVISIFFLLPSSISKIYRLCVLEVTN
jgi:hypothetical protein